MKAKFINETIYLGPDGAISGKMNIDYGALIETIDNTAEQRLFPKDLTNIVDFLIEINDPRIASKALDRLLEIHPYIVNDIKKGGPFKSDIIKFAEYYQNANDRNMFPPMSMN